MSEDKLVTSGELASMEREEKNSGDEIERSEMPSTSSSDPLDQIAELITTGDVSNDEGQDSDGVSTLPNDAEEQSGGEEPDTEETGEDGSQEGHQEEEYINTLSDAAKAIGTSSAKMYDLEIPMGKGEEPVTLGVLKDHYRNQTEWQQDYARRESEISKREVQTAAATQDLAYLQAEIANHVPRERIEQLNEQHKARLAAEGTLLQEAIPEFKDQQFFTNWRNDAVDYTSRFGFKPHELVIHDHRLLVLLNHAMSLEKKLERLAQFKPKPQEVPKRKRAGIRKGQPAKRQPKGREDQLEELAGLVKGAL